MSQWDPTTYRYVRYGMLAATFDPLAFTRIDIKSTGILVNGVSGVNPSGRTYAQEMTNFAIWYSFYRTRIQMMESASGIAFSALDQNSRVGFHTLHENNTLFTNIADFTTANKLTWFTRLYATAPNGGTNLPDGVWRIGELFSGNLRGPQQARVHSLPRLAADSPTAGKSRRLTMRHCWQLRCIPCKTFIAGGIT